MSSINALLGGRLTPDTNEPLLGTSKDFTIKFIAATKRTNDIVHTVKIPNSNLCRALVKFSAVNLSILYSIIY